MVISQGSAACLKNISVNRMNVPQYTSYPATLLPPGSSAPLQVKSGALHVFCHTPSPAAQPGSAELGLPGAVPSYIKVNNVVQPDQLPALSWVRTCRQRGTPKGATEIFITSAIFWSAGVVWVPAPEPLKPLKESDTSLTPMVQAKTMMDSEIRGLGARIEDRLLAVTRPVGFTYSVDYFAICLSFS